MHTRKNQFQSFEQQYKKVNVITAHRTILYQIRLTLDVYQTTIQVICLTLDAWIGDNLNQ